MNKAVYAALGVVVGMVAGVALGMVMSNDGDRPETRTATHDNRPSQTQPDAEPLTANDDRTDEPRPDEPADASEPAPRTPGDALADAIAAVEIEDPPRGDGTITGRITLESGEGVGGVRVTATGVYKREGGNDTDLAETVREEIRREKWKRAAERETTTSADGRYTITGLDPDVEYLINASSDGYKFDRRNRRRYYLKAGDTLDFVASASVKLTVTVLMPDGSRAARASVKAGEAGRNRNTYSTGGFGGDFTLDLKPGTWDVSAESGDHDEFQSESVRVTAEAGKALEPITLKLNTKPGVVGRVSFPVYFGSPQLRVYLQADPPAGAPAEEGVDSDWRRAGVSSATGGDFAFLDVEPGAYRVLLYHENSLVDWADVTVGTGLAEVALELPEPRVEDYIPVRVRGPGGEIPDDVSFYTSMRSLHASSSGDSSDSRGDVLKRGDGVWWLMRRTFDDGPEEQWYEIRVTTQEWGSITRRYERDDTHVLEVRFEEPAWLTLTVPNHNDHERREDLRWRLSAPESDGARRVLRPEAESRDASPFRFGPLPPGEYRLELSAGSRQGSNVIFSEPLRLDSGENHHTADVPRLYDLKVRVANKAEARRLRVYREGQRVASLMFNIEFEGDLLTIANLPAGEYELQGMEGVMSVVVPTSGIVEYAPRKYDCLVVPELKSGGKIEGFGFREGDKVIEVDGQAFENLQAFYAQLQLSLSKDDTTWTVLRNNVRTDVSFNGKELMELVQGRDADERFEIKPGYINE